MPTRWKVLLLVLLAVLPACGKDDSPSESAGGSSSTATSEAGKPELKLLEAGAAPRRVLRRAVAAGAERPATMPKIMKLAQTMDGEAGPPIETPPIDMGMVIHVDRVEGNEVEGTFRYDSVNVVDDGSADPALVQGLKTSGIDKLTTVSGTLRMTTRGELLDASISKPDDFPPAIGQFLDQIEPQLQNMTVPFPKEAVGVGARWSVKTDLTLGGIRLNNEYGYELLEITGDTYKMDLTVKQTAPAQTADLQGVKARITSFVTTGEGDATGRLNEVLPLAFTNHAIGDQAFEFDEAGKTSTLRQHIDMNVTLR